MCPKTLLMIAVSSLKSPLCSKRFSTGRGVNWHSAPWLGRKGLSLPAGGSWGRGGRQMSSGWRELLSPAAYSRRCRDVLWDSEDLQQGKIKPLSKVLFKQDFQHSLSKHAIFFYKAQVISICTIMQGKKESRRCSQGKDGSTKLSKRFKNDSNDTIKWYNVTDQEQL